MTYDFTSLLVVIIVMFLMLVVGYLCRKIGWIDDAASKRLSTLIIKVGQPMMIIGALANAEYTKENLTIAWQVTLIGFVMHALLSMAAFLIDAPSALQKKSASAERVIRSAWRCS